MHPFFQRLTSLAAALALVAPVYAFSETRPPQGTNLSALAADLAKVLGGANVELSGRAPRVREEAPAVPSDSRMADLVVEMNREREARGLRPLRLNTKLNAAAADRVRDMLDRHYFDHVAPDGMQPFVWADREGYRYREIGENLAVGFRVSAVVDGWMHSPGHRANVLGKDYDEVGVAIANVSPTRAYGAPLVVAMYGTE